MNIGVLALQGAFREHVQILARLGVRAREVRLPRDLEGLDGLIAPGGESTTMGKLMVDFGLQEPLRDFAARGALWGTCAGAILMADAVEGREQPLLGVMRLRVQRNAFGRQVDSFEQPLTVAGLVEPFPAVFIRAPVILEVGEGVEILARHEGRIVLARQGRLLASSFHPELTSDDRLHRLFLEIAAGGGDVGEAS